MGSCIARAVYHGICLVFAVYVFPTAFALPAFLLSDQESVIANHVGRRSIERIDLETPHDEIDREADGRLVLAIGFGGRNGGEGFRVQSCERSRVGRDALHRFVGGPERAFACARWFTVSVSPQWRQNAGPWGLTADENVTENAEGPDILLLAAVPSSFQDFGCGKAGARGLSARVPLARKAVRLTRACRRTCRTCATL